MKTPKAILHQMTVDAWGAGMVVFILSLGLEAAERGFVSRVFNLLWLLVFVIVASCAVMATQAHVTEPSSHRPARNAQALLYLGTLAIAPIVWFLLPASVKIYWRAAATGGILLAALVAWPIFSKHE